jgi:hypothetical protein
VRRILSLLVVASSATLAACGSPYYYASTEVPEQAPAFAPPAPLVIIIGGAPATVTAVAEPMGEVAEVGVAHRWLGAWQDTDGYLASFELILESDASGRRFEGYFDWTLVATPPGSRLASRRNDTGRESVRGTFDPASRRLDLVGYNVSDATLFIPDHYRLFVNADGTAITGRARGNNGAWMDTVQGGAVADTATR